MGTLVSLHWNVPENIQYKIVLLTYKAPPYLEPLVCVADLPSHRALQSQAPVTGGSNLPQLVAGPFRFLDREYGMSCPKTLQWQRHYHLLASTEPLPETIFRHSDLTSLLTPVADLVVILVT